MLDAKPHEIARNLPVDDAQALVANGSILRAKFASQSFLQSV